MHSRRRRWKSWTNADECAPHLCFPYHSAVLQTHYPNRLDVAYFRNMSSIVSAFLPLTYPFMNARTSAKLRIGGDPLEDGQATKEELHVDWGGVIDVSVRRQLHSSLCDSS